MGPNALDLKGGGPKSKDPSSGVGGAYFYLLSGDNPLRILCYLLARKILKSHFYRISSNNALFGLPKPESVVQMIIIEAIKKKSQTMSKI